MEFTVHTVDSAPAGSKPLLEQSQKSFGMVPNLHGVMAEAPKFLEAYKTIGALFDATSLSPIERNVVWLTANYENKCHYCMAAHTAIAHGAKVPAEEIDALRAGKPLNDPKLQALRVFTAKMVNERGWVADADLQAFLDAGFTKQNILEVILGVSMKVMSNYSNHIAETDVDAPFKNYVWTDQAA